MRLYLRIYTYVFAFARLSYEYGAIMYILYTLTQNAMQENIKYQEPQPISNSGISTLKTTVLSMRCANFLWNMHFAIRLAPITRVSKAWK